MGVQMKNLKMKNKLLVAFFIIVLLNVIPLAISFMSLNNMRNALHVSSQEAEELEMLKDLSLLIAQQQLAEKNFIITADSTFLEQDESLDESIEEIIDEMVEEAENEEEAAESAEITELIHIYEDLFEEVVDLVRKGQREEAHALMTSDHDRAVKNVNEHLEEMVEDTEEDTEEALVDAGEHSEAAVNWFIFTLAASLASLIVAITISIILSNNITRPILHLKHVAERVSMGDLSVSVPTDRKDEIGELSHSFKRMVTAIRFLASEMKKRR